MTDSAVADLKQRTGGSKTASASGNVETF
jgi:hypothetical protein